LDGFLETPQLKTAEKVTLFANEPCSLLGMQLEDNGRQLQLGLAILRTGKVAFDGVVDHIQVVAHLL
jgi:hypothetical protein